MDVLAPADHQQLGRVARARAGAGTVEARHVSRILRQLPRQRLRRRPEALFHERVRAAHDGGVAVRAVAGEEVPVAIRAEVERQTLVVFTRCHDHAAIAAGVRRSRKRADRSTDGALGPREPGAQVRAGAVPRVVSGPLVDVEHRPGGGQRTDGLHDRQLYRRDESAARVATLDVPVRGPPRRHPQDAPFVDPRADASHQHHAGVVGRTLAPALEDAQHGGRVVIAGHDGLNGHRGEIGFSAKRDAADAVARKGQRGERAESRSQGEAPADAVHRCTSSKRSSWGARLCPSSRRTSSEPPGAAGIRARVRGIERRRAC